MDFPAGRFAPLTLEGRDLACVRGGRRVFSQVSFSIAAGRLLAVTGPNGAGKSSLLRVLAGLLRLESGTLVFDGADEEQASAHYLGHADALKPALTLKETLEFWADLYRGERDPTTAAEAVDLGHALRLPVGVLSAGQRRRAGLARLLTAPRPLWLLDEPASALDRAGEALLAVLMHGHLAAGGMIIAATHQDLPVASDAVLDLGAPA